MYIYTLYVLALLIAQDNNIQISGAIWAGVIVLGILRFVAITFITLSSKLKETK